MKYYVGFMSTSERCWWDMFNRSGFEHVAAFRPISETECIGIEFNKTGLHPESILASPAVALDRMLAREDCTCAIEIELNDDARDWYVGRGMLTCVSATKAFLGLPSFWWVWTPHGLARILLALGGKLHYGDVLKVTSR